MIDVLVFLTIWGCIILGVWRGVNKWRQDHYMPSSEPIELTVPEPKAKTRPGFVYALHDRTRPDLAKIVGSTKELATPLDKMYLIQTRNLDRELQKVYDELADVRVAANWYNRDATEHYFEHRMGAA